MDSWPIASKRKYKGYFERLFNGNYNVLKNIFIEFYYDFIYYPFKRIMYGFDDRAIVLGFDWYLAHQINDMLDILIKVEFEDIPDNKLEPDSLKLKQIYLEIKKGFQMYVDSYKMEEYYYCPYERFEHDPEFKKTWENSWELLKIHLPSMWY